MSNHSKKARVLVVDDLDEADGAPDATEVVDVLMTLLDHEAKGSRRAPPRRRNDRTEDDDQPELVVLAVGLHGHADDVARELRRRTGKRSPALEPSSAKLAPGDRSKSHGPRPSRRA